MGKSLYLDEFGKLTIIKRTIQFIDPNGKKIILPIEQIEAIISTSKTTFSSGTIKTLLRKGIIVHFLSGGGSYLGTLLPSNTKKGQYLVKQVQKYMNEERYLIASEIINGIRSNMNAFLRKHNSKIDFSVLTGNIKDINILRGEEAVSWIKFYKKFRELIKYFKFEKRIFNPPTDEINAMISFINALLYSTTLTAIYKSGLEPAISYLHEPSFRSFSLALDISDIFKPVVTFSIILKLVNHKIIKEDHFERTNDGVYLNKEGRRIVINEFNSKIFTPFYCKKYRRDISLKTLIEFEVYNLRNFIVNNKEYKSFKVRSCT